MLYQLSYWPESPESGSEPASLDDVGDGAGADRPAALANREANALLHRDRSDQLHVQRHVVTRHHHLGAFAGRLEDTRHVRRAEVELRTVAVEERRVTTTLFLRSARRPHRLNFVCGVDRASASPEPGHARRPSFLVPRSRMPTLSPASPRVQQLAEHLHAGHHRRLRGVADAHDLHRRRRPLITATLDTAGHHRAAALESRRCPRSASGTLCRPSRSGVGDVVIHRRPSAPPILERPTRAPDHRPRGPSTPNHWIDRDVVARELVGGLRSSRISISTSSRSSSSSTMSHLLRKTHDRTGTPTWRASRMCSRSLGHRAVRGRHHQDRAVHLRGARDHVLHVVRVTRAVDVGVVTVLPSRTPREPSRS